MTSADCLGDNLNDDQSEEYLFFKLRLEDEVSLLLKTSVPGFQISNMVDVRYVNSS